MNFSKTIVMGRIGRDPELKYTPGGAAVAKFSIATSEKWKDKTTNTMRENTEWHNVEVWGKQAEMVNQYFKKGSMIGIEGKNKTDSWDDKDTGKKVYKTSIKVDKVYFGPKSDSNISGGDDKSLDQQALDLANSLGGSAEVSKIDKNASFATDDIPF